MGFRETWIHFIHRAATGSRAMRSFLTPVGVVLFTVFTAVFVLAAVISDRLLQLPPLLPESLSLPLSVLLLAAGVALSAWSAFHFLKAKGTPVPFNPPTRVVTTGPYRYVRNPMVSGVFLILLGIGLAINSISLVFLFTPAFVLFNRWELKHIEEPELMKRLGKEYIEYHKQTPMFLPRSRPKGRLGR